MKTSVEINGYVISIEELEGVISVNATKDEEVIEEFTIEIEEGEEGEESDNDEVQGFGQFGQEEEDFGQEESQEDDEDEDEDESQEEDDEKRVEGQLESFQSFIGKKK
jgi:hypothetical protein